jgi:CubicO group peptidase (beta-lactamase class C family)
MSARDMARFGVLYQMNGMWKDSRIIPSAWITESTKAYSIEENTYGLGYGYMWKIMPEGSPLAEMIGHPGYFHTGIGVHALVIIPKLKLVIVERLDTDGDWVDPGDVGMALGKMIIEARITD